MTLTLAASLVLAQITAPAAPATLEDDRLAACLTEARTDPAQAIITAGEWRDGLSGPATSHPTQCLGFAYMGLLRWEAAQQAFVEARNALPIDARLERARLGAMAGNAALAAEDFILALPLLQAARTEASSAGDGALSGQIMADIARAQVNLGSEDDAATSLEEARALAPQNSEVWLLSATLARRMDDLTRAQGWIETASRLDPANPAIGLEAGLIAALAGREDAALASWLSVIETAGGSPQAAAARSYIQQLEGEVPAR